MKILVFIDMEEWESFGFFSQENQSFVCGVFRCQVGRSQQLRKTIRDINETNQHLYGTKTMWIEK